jgi:threonine dehydratase
MQFGIDFDEVHQAAGRLADVAQRTPVLRSGQADECTGAQVFFMCENTQRMDAFMFRVAYNALSRFTPA